MKIAFYAPLKPPDHPTPSGDRLIARLLLKALAAAGHEPFLAARFRSYDGRGDPHRQRRLQALGERLAGRLLRRLARREAAERPGLWLTYHLYHKAPDWIGPIIARALDVPYVVVEASVAPKQADGPWRASYAAANRAIAAADLVVSLNRSDLPCLRRLLAGSGRLVHLEPFLDLTDMDARPGAGGRAGLAAALGIPASAPWLVTVAMMREGNKLDSYRVLARALGRHRGLPWRLLVAGDGPARSRVEAAFLPLGPDRVRFLGARSGAEIAALLRACDLFLWPAVAEPLGMAMLEAHAAGLAVVAGDSGGVSDIVRHGETGLLASPGDAAAFAEQIRVLLEDHELRADMGVRARARVEATHSLEQAAATLGRWIGELTVREPS